MGVVYLGRHEKLGQRVVVKVLRPEMSSHADMVQRFFNEAQAATAIQNPGIAQVFDVGTTRDGRAYFVMELLKGETLTARLRQGQGQGQGRLAAEACCRIGRQIANVLAAAHAAGITHRDLKPDNLFLVPDAEVMGGERVKVLDFGIAKLAGDASSVRTRLGVAMGTPRYMAPEQCSNASAADARSDVYALGCVLFRMACGRPPFIEKDLLDLVNAQLCDPPPDPLRFAPELPPALGRLILQMLEKDPAARPQTMAEISRALDEILRTLGAALARASEPLMPLAPAVGAPAVGAPAVGAPAVVPESASPSLSARTPTTLEHRAGARPAPVASTEPGAPVPTDCHDEPSPAPARSSAARGRRSEQRTQELRPARSVDDQVTTLTARPLLGPAAPTEETLKRPPAQPRSAADALPLPLPAAPELSAVAPLPLPPPPPLPPLAAAPLPLRTTPESSAAVTLPTEMARSSSTISAPQAGAASSGELLAVTGETAGMGTRASRRGVARWSAVLGVFAALGAAIGIVVVLLSGGSRGAGGQVAYGEQTARPRAGAIRVEPIEAAPAVPAPAAPAPAPAAPAPAAPAPAAPAPVAGGAAAAAACEQLQQTRRWSELAQCAEELAPRDPRRAAALRSRAAEEVRSAPRIAAAEAALRAHDLRRASVELAQVWTGAVDYPALRGRYDRAEARAIDELAARLERAIDPDCKAYEQLLAHEQGASPPRVAQEAAGRATCTPRACDADGLADAGQAHYVVSRLPEALAAYEAAYACRPEPRWAEKLLVISCNLADREKARRYWAQLPAILRPRIVEICQRSGITRDLLDAP